MKDTQTRKVNMGAAVQLGLRSPESDAIISANPTAVAKRTELEDNLLDIEEADEQQQATGSGGEKITKTEAKHNMADQADIIAQALCTLALDTNNHTLYEQMNVHAPAIFHMKDVDSMAFCQLVVTNANTNLVALATYNVTAATVALLQDAIISFGQADPAPRDAQGEHHTATTNVSLGIVAMMKTLQWWDHFVGTHRTSNPDFYSNYKTWRKIVNTGVRHVSVRGLVTDSVTNTPLYKVKITRNGNDAAVRSGKTGKYNIFSLTPGVYTLTFSLNGYHPLAVPNVSVLDGKITELPVSLIKL